MIRNILCATLMVSSLFYGFSQTHLNIKGGLNYTSNQEVNGDLPRQYIAGFHLGIATRFDLSERVSLMPELLYSKKGYKYEVEVFDGSSSSIENGKVFLNYLSLPILVNFSLTERLELSLGPEIGYLISAKDQIFGTSSDVKELYNGFDFGLATGISYNLNERLSVGTRYTHGLSSVLDNLFLLDENREVMIIDANSQNRTFQIFASYNLQINP